MMPSLVEEIGVNALLGLGLGLDRDSNGNYTARISSSKGNIKNYPKKFFAWLNTYKLENIALENDTTRCIPRKLLHAHRIGWYY